MKLSPLNTSTKNNINEINITKFKKVSNMIIQNAVLFNCI